MFSTSSAVQTCTGPALQAAKKVISHVGGKLCLFQSSLPTLGEGALKNRENPKFIGTDKEHNLLNAEDPWYKENAVDFSRLQVRTGSSSFLVHVKFLCHAVAGGAFFSLLPTCFLLPGGC